MSLKADWVNGDTVTATHLNAVATTVNGLDVGAAANTVINVKAPPYNATGNGTTNDTAAIQAAINSGNPVYIPPGNYLVTALNIPDEITQYVDATFIEGSGPDAALVFATPNSTLFHLTYPKVRLVVKNLRLRLTATATGSTLVDCDNSFKHVFDNVTFEGMHQVASVSTFRTQIGVKFRNISGENKFVNCQFNNFGVAVLTDTIMNYLVNCEFSFCWKGVQGGDPTGTNFFAGISMINCSMVGSASGTRSTDTWIEVTGAANHWWIEKIWIEGCDKGVVLGSGTNGPQAFSMTDMYIAATTKCIDIVAARQTYLVNVSCAFDPAQTPTELSINATNAPDGFAANLFSSQVAYIPASVFPSGWAYFGRASTNLLGNARITTVRDSNDNIVLNFASNASAVNYLTIANHSAGNPPLVIAEGANADIDIVFAPKGGGAFRIYRGAGQTSASVIAYGSATDIDLNLQSQGVGRVKENGNLVGSWVSVPSTATSAGKVGQMAADASWLYICTATNTWRRVAIASW